MTWTAEDEEEFAPVDVGEHVLTLPEEHIEGSKGPEGQPLTPEQFAARARAQDIDLDRPDVMEANGLAATSSSMPGEYGAAALDALSMLTNIQGVTRQDSQPAAADRTVRRLTRTGSEAASDPLETASAAMSGATMGASDVSSSPMDDAIAVGRMLGIDIPADRERQWARDDAQARSEDWREANPHATEAAELGGSFAGMTAMPNPAPARTMGGRFLQNTVIGGGMGGLASLIDDLGHGRTDDPRAMARHAFGAAALGSTMGMGAGMLGEVPGLTQRLLQRRGSQYVDHLIAMLENSGNLSAGTLERWGIPSRRAATVERLERQGFGPRLFEAPEQALERLEPITERAVQRGDAFRQEGEAVGAGTGVEDAAHQWEGIAREAELDPDVSGRLADVPGMARREADALRQMAQERAEAGRPLGPDQGRVRELERALAEAERGAGRPRAPRATGADTAEADEMLRRRRGAEYVEPEVTVEEPEVYDEPDVEVTPPEGPAIDAALARLQAAQQAYDAGPRRPPFMGQPDDALPQGGARRRAALERAAAFDPSDWRNPVPGLSPEQLQAARAARDAEVEAARVAREPLEREVYAAQQAYNDLANPFAGREERAYGVPEGRDEPTEGRIVWSRDPLGVLDRPAPSPRIQRSLEWTAVDAMPAGADTVVAEGPYRVSEPRTRDTVIEPTDAELSPVGDTQVSEGTPEAVRDDLRTRRLRGQLERARAAPSLGPVDFEAYLRGLGDRAHYRPQGEPPVVDAARQEARRRLRDIQDESLARALSPERAAEFEPIRLDTQAAMQALTRARHGVSLGAGRAPTGIRSLAAGGLGASIGGTLGGAIGHHFGVPELGTMAGTALGGLTGRELGQFAARRARSQQAWVSRLARDVGGSSAASWASRWAPRLAQAAAAGPDALLAAHLTLSQEDPEYAALADEELGPLPEDMGEEMPEEPAVAESGPPESDQGDLRADMERWTADMTDEQLEQLRGLSEAELDTFVSRMREQERGR